MGPECSQIAAWLEKKVGLPPHNDPMNQGFCVADPLQCWHMYYEDINWWKYKNSAEMPVCLKIRMVWKPHQCNLSHWISSLRLKSCAPFSWIELTVSLFKSSPFLCQSPVPAPAKWLAFPELRPALPLPTTHWILEPNSFKKCGNTPPPQMKTSQKMWAVFVPPRRLFARHWQLHIIRL